MFRNVRLQLTLLYTLAALALLALVGAGAYLTLASYFEGVTNLALRHKMTHEFHILAAPIPTELASADRDWSILRGERGEVGEDEQHRRNPAEAFRAAAYDAELAAIFVLPLDSGGRLLFDPNPYAPPLTPDRAALATALRNGSDLRTVTTGEGARVRLLTYRLTRDDGPAALQLGRLLADQEYVLGRLLAGLLGLGGLSLALVGAISWWLAGRSLAPARLAWERQQSFIASASHELRTPLTLIRASAEVALRATPADDADQREILGDLLTASDHMRRLVDDLLTLSRIDAGRLPCTPARVELAELLEEVARQVGRLASEGGVRLSVTQAEGAALADRDQLRQILLILLDNALRHTRPGGAVTLQATTQGARARITVADTGVGIPPEHLPHVFERFYRADEARGASGAGLGLSIAQGLAQAQSGAITLESKVGEGTTACVTLPAGESLVSLPSALRR